LTRADLDHTGRVLDAERALQHEGALVDSGVCPGSSHPAGLCMRATLIDVLRLFTSPTNSSISFGGSPAAVTCPRVVEVDRRSPVSPLTSEFLTAVKGLRRRSR
jgi:hypothetical protein